MALRSGAGAMALRSGAGGGRRRRGALVEASFVCSSQEPALTSWYKGPTLLDLIGMALQQ